MTRRASRVDTTQAAVVRALERCGFLVWLVNKECDLVVQRAGRTEIIEVKGAKKSLTPTQKKMLALGWKIHIVHNPAEALRAVLGEGGG